MRKVMLGAAAVLLVGAAGVVPGRPAGAQQTGGYVTWQSPDDGARISGQTVHIKAKAGFYGGVKSWAVEVLAPQDADYPGYGTVCERTESRSPAAVNVDWRNRLDGQRYALVGFRVTRGLRRASIYLEGTNLGNVSYEEVAGVSMPGRWISAGLPVR